MTLYQPINQRWVEERGENWSHGELVDDGIVKRSATVEATTRLGRKRCESSRRCTALIRSTS